MFDRQTPPAKLKVSSSVEQFTAPMLAQGIEFNELVQAAKNAFAASCRLARSVLMYIDVVERLA